MWTQPYSVCMLISLHKHTPPFVEKDERYEGHFATTICTGWSGEDFNPC